MARQSEPRMAARRDQPNTGGATGQLAEAAVNRGGMPAGLAGFDSGFRLCPSAAKPAMVQPQWQSMLPWPPPRLGIELRADPTS